MRLSALVTFWYSWYSILTRVHSFFYVHIRFRKFRIAIRPNRSNYYNITNVPTTLYLSQMKQISGSHYFLHLFTNSNSCSFPIPVKQVVCFQETHYCIILRDYLHLYDLKFSKQVFWKFCKIHRKTSVSQCVFNHPASF